MAATTFSFRQGDSYTIGIRLDANYDISGLQEIKVSLFGETFAPDTTADPRVFKIEISSDESAALNSAYYPLELFLDDANFGVKKFVLAIAYATPSATASNGSINTGYDIVLDVKIADAPIDIVATVITLAKGEKGDRGERGERGADGGIADGDKGDLLVTGGGVNWALKSQQLANKFVFGETPSGAINGSNAVFTTANQFIPETLTVEVNGLTQKLVDDYTVSGGLTITLLVSPVVGDSILVNYIKV